MSSKAQHTEGHYPGRPSVGHSLLIIPEHLESEEANDTRANNLGFSRKDCIGGPRPCPLVGCPFNNYLEVSPTTGHIRIAHGEREPEDMPPDESCCLDMADHGPQTLEHVGAVLGLTRERIRQIEMGALKKIRKELGDKTLREWIEKLPTP
jgi:hypothetical protein